MKSPHRKSGSVKRFQTWLGDDESSVTIFAVKFAQCPGLESIGGGEGVGGKGNHWVGGGKGNLTVISQFHSQ